MKVQAKLILMVMGIVGCLVHCGNAQRPPGFCTSPYVEIAGKCYNFHQDSMTWHSAKTACNREGAKLASVLTNAQYNGILSHLNANFAGIYWVSGAAVSGRWIWTATGDQMSSAWWGRNRVPSANANTCAYFCSNTLRYWPKSCSFRMRYICEKDTLILFNVLPEQGLPHRIFD